MRGRNGDIVVRLGEGHRRLEEVLAESIWTRPLRRGGPGPSTYWIDRALGGVRAAVESGSTEVFASGNVTYLRLEGDRVIADDEVEEHEEHAEAIAVDDFVSLLERWRQVVIEAGGAIGGEARPMGP